MIFTLAEKCECHIRKWTHDENGRQEGEWERCSKPVGKPKCTKCSLMARHALGRQCPIGTHCNCCTGRCQTSRAYCIFHILNQYLYHTIAISLIHTYIIFFSDVICGGKYKSAQAFPF